MRTYFILAILTLNYHFVFGQNIFLTPDEILDIKKKTTSVAWAKQEFEQLIQRADQFVKTNIEKEIPALRGNWNNYYISPESNRLTLGKQIGPFKWEHRDIVTGKIYTSSSDSISKDYDGVIIAKIHQLWSRGILELGLAYKLTDDKKYAAKVKEALLRYAAIYPDLSVRNYQGGEEANTNGHGKLFPQSLEESGWLIHALSGASLIWETLSEKEQIILRSDLFLPMAEYISHNSGIIPFIHNIDCWEVAAIGMTGLFFNDQRLIDIGYNDQQRGYRQQIEKGINADGFWLEHSIGYQFHALYPLIMANRAGNNYGMALDQIPLKKLLDSPLKILDAKNELPAFNDSDRRTIGEMAFFYEWGYKTFHDSLHTIPVNAMKRGAQPDLPHYFTAFALVFGSENIPASPKKVLQSYNYPHSGLAALTLGNGSERLWVSIKYHRQSKFHIHADVGSFEITKGYELISADPGKTSYASPLDSGWYRSSFSHNTFLINGKQQLKNLQITCEDYGTDQGAPYIRIKSRGLFDGHEVQVTRTIALIDKDLVFVADQFTSNSLDTIQISYHQGGVL